MSMTKILITGATGYIGGLLLYRLSEKGLPLRAVARHPENLTSRLPKGEIEVVQGNVQDESSMEKALDGIEVAFYLVHSMGAAYGKFEELDKKGAEIFARACEKKGVKRIIYLGGLSAAPEERLSDHMRSRQEVGKILRAHKTPVIEFQSSIILGPGSLSYDLMTALVKRLPLMVAPTWVSKKTQPIHVQDVLQYLEEAITIPLEKSIVVEIGGSETVTYKNLMLEYAKQKGLKRHIFVVPVLTPTLSAMWLGLVTPVYKRIGRKLIESITNDSIVTHPKEANRFSVKPKSYKEALKISEEDSMKELKRRWFDAISAKGISRNFENVTFKKRQDWVTDRSIEAPANVVYAYIKRLGGHEGWYADFLWKIRAAIDVLVGGVGFRRGRIDPKELRVGDPVDFWRVIEMQENKRIVFKAEMKLPGRAYLAFTLKEQNNHTEAKMESIFDPIGAWGVIYWYLMWPFHYFIFDGLLDKIKTHSEKNAKELRS